VPLAALPAEMATGLWLVVRVGLLVAACAVMPVPPTVRAASFGVACFSQPVLLDLNLGNVSIVVLALSALAWRMLDRPVAGLAIALGALLRAPLVLLAIPWLARRRWEPLVAAAAAGLVAFAASLPFVGIGGWLDYARIVRNLGGFTGVPRNADASSAAVALGMPEPIPTLAFLGFAAAAAVALAASLRRDRDTSFVVTVGATLLISPLLWAHYLALLVLPAAFLASRGRPWGLALPLLGWLPEPALPLAALGGTLLPLLARPPAASGQSSPLERPQRHEIANLRAAAGERADR
jgi:hypothetical protein